MEEARLAYRVRPARLEDEARLRAAIGATLVKPERGGRRESYRGAATRGDLLVLERYDRQARAWDIAGFVEYHLRVDETLSIRDMGTAGEEPQVGVVRYLLDQVLGSFTPAAAQVKVRRDAREWQEIFGATPGFYVEGEEYRRPHYWTIWRWDQEHVRQARRMGERPGQARGPRPPAARPSGPQPPAGRRTAPGRRGPRPSGPAGSRSGPRGPR